MKTVGFTVKTDGFCGLFSKIKDDGGAAMIIMNDDGPDDFLAKTGVKWLNRMKLSALAVGPQKDLKGLHSWPLEEAEAAVQFLKNSGYEKIGICGISAGSNMALCAAVRIPDITLTIALTPVDFVHWGYLHDGLDGMPERPAEGESAYTWRSQSVPCMKAPFHHPDYWNKAVEEKKRRKDMFAALDLYEAAEKYHPLQEEEIIPTEKINGRLLLAGAEDDVLWNTCRSIRRMKKRIETSGSKCQVEYLIYEHCTHFIFPQSLLNLILPSFAADLVLPHIFKEAKGYVKQCRQSREDLDQHIRRMIDAWRREDPVSDVIQNNAE